MKIENEEELGAIAEALQDNEDTQLFLKVKRGEVMFNIGQKIYDELNKKVVKKD